MRKIHAGLRRIAYRPHYSNKKRGQKRSIKFASSVFKMQWEKVKQLNHQFNLRFNKNPPA